LLPDYLVERDLPSAYQRATGISSGTTATVPKSAISAPPKGHSFEIPVRDLRRAADVETHGKVRLRAGSDIGKDAFAVRVPAPGLPNAGFRAGGWVIVRPTSQTDLGSDAWLVVLRARGRFGATGSNWTIAHAKELPGDESTPERLQVSYGSATGKEYRPERIDRADLTLAAAVLCHADDDS
jgi:hypothetical protein